MGSAHDLFSMNVAMALDPHTKTVWLVAAECTANPGKKWGSDVATYCPHTHFEDTRTVLSLQVR